MGRMRRRPTSAASFYGDSGYDPSEDPNGPGGGYASQSNAPHSAHPLPSPMSDEAAQRYGTQSTNRGGYQGRNPNAPGSAVAQGAAGTGTRLANPHGQQYGYTPPGGWTDDQGNTKTFQTGMYDPSDPTHQYNADGSFDLGKDNGQNEANFWQGQQHSLSDLSGQTTAKRAQAAGSRAIADHAAGAMPAPYQAPAAWQAPGAMPAAYQRTPYQSPSPWQDPTQGAMPGPYAGNGPRNAITSTHDIAGDTSTLASALKGASGAAPVQAGAVGGGGAAFNNYARGASNSLLTSLKQQLGAQTDSAAGRGRIGSGFYDQDVGSLARGLASDSENNILSGALQAASLDQSAAVGNADRAERASEFNAGQGQTAALAGLSTAASTGIQRSALDQSDYSTDQGFGLARQGQNYGQSADARNFSRANYADDRNFGADAQRTDFQQGITSQAQDYGQATDARNFSRSSYDDDRNFGSQQQQTNYGQSADQRDYARGAYQFDENDANNQSGQYLNQLNSNTDRFYQQQEQARQNKGPGIGGILGGLAGTVLGSALGPIGAAAGSKIGSSIFGGGSNGGGNGGYSTAAPEAIPGFAPDQGYQEEDDPYAQYASGGYANYGGYYG